ncbi:hypothetical protein NDU88_000007 [Pleurodeles waltl]|uniref:Uncharacterized protein n=1 Tax=Pleurodeles waltl TaxID=8319 RepID=A0AAV7LUM4_PLEWA|nr:hypothetical protein NDU88_000007 [Pleurodeles waltl]
MGKSDHKQTKLSSDACKKSGSLSRAGLDEDVSEPAQQEVPQSLVDIDTELDYLTDRMDCLKDRVDDHDSRLDQLLRRMSDLDDGRHTSDEQLSRWKNYLRSSGIKMTILKLA